MSPTLKQSVEVFLSESSEVSKVINKHGCSDVTVFSPSHSHLTLPLLWSRVKGKCLAKTTGRFIIYFLEQTRRAGCQVSMGPRRRWRVNNSLIIFTHVSFALISRRERELFSRKPMVLLDTVEVGQHSERRGVIQEIQKKQQKNTIWTYSFWGAQIEAQMRKLVLLDNKSGESASLCSFLNFCQTTSNLSPLKKLKNSQGSRF